MQQPQKILCQVCTTSIPKKLFSIHYEMCSTKYLRSSIILQQQYHVEQQCKYCLKVYQKKELNVHVDLCQHRQIACVHCSCLLPKSLFKEHLDVCRELHPELVIYGEEEQLINIWIKNVSMLWVGIVRQAKKQCMRFLPQLYSLSFSQTRDAFLDALDQLVGNIAQEQGIVGMLRKQIKLIPQLSYKNTINYTLKHQCTICFCQIDDIQYVKQLKCKHVFHIKCINKWLGINRSCPNCKNDYNYLNDKDNRR